jgi:hypothetical protein
MNSMSDPPLELSNYMAAGIGMTIFVKKETIFVSRQNSIAKK